MPFVSHSFLPAAFRPLLMLLLCAGQLRAEGFSRAELQQFIDEAIAAGGGVVLLPPGVHRIDQPVVIKNAPRLRLSGLDAEDTVLTPVKDAAKGFPLIRVEGSAAGLLIDKLTLTTSGEAFSGMPLIEVAGSGGGEPSFSVRVDRCFLQKHAGPGIVLKGVKDGGVTGCTFMDLGGAAIMAGGGSSALTLQHNHLTRTGSPSIQLDDSTSECRIIANELHSGRIAAEGSGHESRDNLVAEDGK